MDKYWQEQVHNGNYIPMDPHTAKMEGHQIHFVGYNFVVSSTSSSTKVRMTTDSSMRTESGLSLNDVTKPAPGVVLKLRCILLRSRCRKFFAVYDIKKFFRSVRISERDSYLRIVCIPFPSFSAAPCSEPSWIFYRDQAIPFGDSASGDYASCAKTATVLAFIDESPVHLQEAIKQAVLEDTYVDDGGVGADSQEESLEIQTEISSILRKGGFFIKEWECSGEDGVSKYLGMTWDRFHDSYSLKFRLNLHKKFRGIPSGEDLDSAFLDDPEIPVTKKNVLSVACQFYDPAGLASPIMFPVRALFSEICRDSKCSMTSTLNPERSTRFKFAVGEWRLNSSDEVRHVVFECREGFPVEPGASGTGFLHLYN